MRESSPKIEPNGKRHFPFSFSNGGYFPSFEAESRFDDYCAEFPGLAVGDISQSEGVSAAWSAAYRDWERTPELALKLIRFWNAIFSGETVVDCRQSEPRLPSVEVGGEAHCRVVPQTLSQGRQEWRFLVVSGELRIAAAIDSIVVSTVRESSAPECSDVAQEVHSALAFHSALSEVIPDLALADVRTIARHIELFSALLSPAELGYFSRYIPARSRVEFCGGRILAKSLIASALGVSAEPLSCVEARRGPLCEPVVYVSGEAVPHCCVSISHKDRFIVCALSRSGRVGVDVERISDALRKIEGQFLTARDRECLAAARWEGAAYDAALARVWTAKEAIVKLRRSTYAEMLAHSEALSLGTESSEYLLRDSGENVRIEHRSHSGYMFSLARHPHN